MTLLLDDAATRPTTTRPTPTPVARGRRRRPGRTAQRILLTTHVLSAVGWFGVALAVAFSTVVGRSTDEVAIYELVQATLWLTIPLGAAAAGTGIAVSLTTRWGLARHWWIVAKEAITVAVIATDVLVVAPAMREAAETGTLDEIPGPIVAHCVVLAIATVLSVVKPRARTPLGRRHSERPGRPSGAG